MPFFIIQTRKTKKSRPSMTVVPSNWVEEKFVFWPPKNLISLSKDETSEPDKQSWIRQKCKLLSRAKTFQEAEEAMNTLEKLTDSEDAIQMSRGTRSTAAKKHTKFQCKSYQLIPPTVAHDEVPTSAEEICHSTTPSQSNQSQPLHGTQMLQSETAVACEPDMVPAPTCRRIVDTHSEVHHHEKAQPNITVRPVYPDITTVHQKPARVPNHQSITNQQMHCLTSTKSTSASSIRNANVMHLAPVSSTLNISSIEHARPMHESTSTFNPSSSIINIGTTRASLPGTAALYNCGSTANTAHRSSLGVQHQIANYVTSEPPRTHTVVPTRHQIQVGLDEIVNHPSTSGGSIPRQIAVPIVIGDDGKQYAQLDNECFYPIEENSNEVFVNQMPHTIKQDELDIGADNELDMNESQPEFNDPDCLTIATELRKMNERFDIFERNLSSLTSELCKINERLHTQEGLLTRLTEFMANFNRLMSTKSSMDITMTSRHEEDFSEFEKMQFIDSDQFFKDFEHRLADPKYSEKFFRYLHSIYSLNGKRDSGPLFRTIVRKLVAPKVFLPYSWMGNKRAKRGSPNDSGENINFKETFPNFIKIMHQVLLAADCSSTREQNENLFKTMLRYKNVEMQRYESGNGERRASSSRKRVKKQKTVSTDIVQSSENVNHIESSQTRPVTVEQPFQDQSDTSESENGEDSSDTDESE